MLEVSDQDIEEALRANHTMPDEHWIRHVRANKPGNIWSHAEALAKYRWAAELAVGLYSFARLHDVHPYDQDHAEWLEKEYNEFFLMLEDEA